MDTKGLLYLSGLLMILLAVAWLSGVFGDEVSTVELPELTIDTGAITRIQLTSGDESIDVSRSEQVGWSLTAPIEASADTSTVSRFTTQLDDVKLEGIVSSNPDNYDKYQVDSSSATYVRIETGSEAVEFYVGKSGPDFESKYVRLGDDDRVFLSVGLPSLSTTTPP